MSNLDYVFSFNGNQNLVDEGTYRRYDIDSNLVVSQSKLIKELYTAVENNLPFDGYKIYKAVLSFNDVPRRPMACIDIDFDEKMNDKFITVLINSIESMDLKIEHGIIWTYTDKQQGRNNLSSWRNKVVKDNVCACCGGDKHLEAHHVFSYANYDTLRDDPNNGIALCKWCHKKYHSYYPDDANPKNLVEFIKRFGGK